ncbi:MAG: DUF6273 domain-containing protein [Cellulomonas sp.]|jgi:hypothetical protein|nr:DUF6273 domain-containing protein [Cellulomonas sp.]
MGAALAAAVGIGWVVMSDDEVYAVDYRTRPPSTADEVDAVARQVADRADLVRLSGIDWRVLEVTSDRALLLADRVIGTGPYHGANVDVTWGRCDLRRWLNGAFLESLGEPLVSRVPQVTVRNGPNPIWGTDGGPDTTDRVFLLSMEEAASYLAGKEPDWTTYRSGGSLWSEGLVARNEENETAWWWLRSPGYRPDNAARVSRGGDLYDRGDSVSASSAGVRPAFWLNLES